MSQTIPPDVLILAAGRGTRLRPYTDRTPKPLLRVGAHSLLEHHLHRLHAQGFTNIVINLAWLGEQIQAQIGDGARFGLTITYSQESPTALESGGGIAQALQYMTSDPFLVINGDIWCDCNYADLRLTDPFDMHLVAVPNPPHHKLGDFALSLAENKISDKIIPLIPPTPIPEAKTKTKTKTATCDFTYAGIGYFRRHLFTAPPQQRFPLAPIIQHTIAKGRASAQIHRGGWIDVGTISRLKAARQAQKQLDAQKTTPTSVT